MTPLGARASSGRACNGHISRTMVHNGASPATRICARPFIRSATSMSSGSSTTTHTQWCDQDTGDTRSAVNATVTTAVVSSPRRCASTASASPATATTSAETTQNTAAPVVSPKLRRASPRNDWFATKAGPLPPETRVESRNRPCSQYAVDASGAVSQPIRVITAKAPHATAAARKTTGQDQVHHEDPGDELAGSRDTD